MILLQTIASDHQFREPAANEQRTALYRELLAIAKQQSADALLLPGGFWSASHESDVEPLIERLVSEAKAADVTLIAGLDFAGQDDKRNPSKSDRRPSLPYFGFVGGSRCVTSMWQQTSSTSENAENIPDEDVPGRERIVRLGDETIGVLICGELFNWRARQAMIDLSPTLVVDLGHQSMGMGVTPNLERIAKEGKCAVVHTHHVAPSSRASLHFVNSNGRRESIPCTDCVCVGDESLWIAWCLRRT